MRRSNVGKICFYSIRTKWHQVTLSFNVTKKINLLKVKVNNFTKIGPDIGRIRQFHTGIIHDH